MSLRNLPQAAMPTRPQNFQWDAPSDVLTRWADVPQAAASEDANTITIYDQIGVDWWTGEGTTAKRIAGALRNIGTNPVTVNVNSPGGDMFEGIAIYNLLAAHPAAVTVNVMGLAASAASIIAMAGDTINMGVGSFLMIHNAWGVIVGNKNDMRAAADTFDGFDGALADIYHARTGMKLADVKALLDAETWLNSSDAIAKGFADATISDPAPAAKADARDHAAILARRRTEGALAQAGISRAERHQMISAMMGSSAMQTPPAARDAGEFDAAAHAAAQQLLFTLQA
ncbi:head maturation protease, ClpP-related [Novosphingobium sp. SG707]|uniref:head maturation protease, ClpP-related n=1 Tax=Novosphingobium sp. SG707 TaxID=2586996 RepID=UPI0014475517|nr:head maturation protease, ClpP-related [Novosphingobium sp. SG707]NKI99596.1 ATP-dependent protease ClpP protease subunit [Novosphingobium sp. SG707]